MDHSKPSEEVKELEQRLKQNVDDRQQWQSRALKAEALLDEILFRLDYAKKQREN